MWVDHCKNKVLNSRNLMNTTDYWVTKIVLVKRNKKLLKIASVWIVPTFGLIIGNDHYDTKPTRDLKPPTIDWDNKIAKLDNTSNLLKVQLFLWASK